ncbi:MAG: PKD domain-containing protein, partial [Flavobacteriales bacterium]|nr:PKD domain-containing protein [Flavobacteriales bacterium]
GNAGPGATYSWNFAGGTVASGSGAGPYQVNWPAPGTYNITLTVTENGCASTLSSQNVNVSTLPSAAFSVNPSSACPGQPITVTYTGGAPANAQYNWNFGGAVVQSGSGAGPYTISYTNPNSYNISLQVNVGGCISAPSTQTVLVNPIPTSSFNIPFTGCAQNPVTINYTGNATPGATYNWNFDGATVISGSGQGPYQIQWPQQGIYNVSLQVTENGCTSSTTTQPISINANPVASFSVNPSPACVGQPVTITYTGNMPPNVSYTYNFPGGNIISGIGQGPFQVNWPNSGTYNLTLMVIASGCTSQVFTQPLTVNTPPTSSFSVNPNAVCEGQNVSVNYTGTGSPNASYNWNFGNGTVVSGSGQGPYQVNWNAAGTPSISLTVTENGCVSPPTTLPVTVYPIPTATFTAMSPLCPGQNGSVNYTGSASPGATYAWNFGGATVVSGSGQGPYQVQWNAAGSYNLSLTVTENGCISAPVSQSVLVNGTPSSSFSLPSAACAGEPVTISYTGASGAQAQYTWNFDGATVISGSGQGPYQVQWNSSGTPTVSLTVNDNGCVSPPTNQNITIHPIPTANFTATSPVCPGENALVTYTGSAGPNAQYSWNFGTGNVTSGSGPGPYQVQWSGSGQQTISLTVTENGCQSAPLSQNVLVHPTPTASFNLTPAVCVDAPAVITYTGTASANATYAWDFGSGTVLSGTGQGPYQVSWGSSGQAVVSLVVTENNCPSLPFSQTVTIHPIPTANFTAPLQLCEGELGTLTYTGNAGAGASFNWNFSGGQALQGAPSTQPQVAWNSAGPVTVTLVVDENNCTSPAHSETLQIHAHPSATFTVTPQICDGQSATVTYTGNANGQNASFNWNFGGGQVVSGSGAGPYQISWNGPGVYSISLDVAEFGCPSNTESQTVTVFAIPTADFSLLTPICEGGQSVLTYTGSAGNAATYNWSLDGGTLVSGSGSGPITVAWAAPGTYNPALTVTENGCTSTAYTTPVTVHAIPTSSFTLNNAVCSGMAATATYTGNGSVNAQYNWGVGGGGTIQSGSGAGPINILWSNPGTFSVDLSVTENGCTSPVTTHTIVVHPIPSASFNAPQALCEGQSGQFSYTGSAGPQASYTWDFSGGQIASGAGAGPYQVSWNTASNIAVTLTVSENGCTSQPFSTNLTIHPIPTSDFTVTSACLGQASVVTYTGTAGAGASYQWNFGSGVVQSGSGQGPYQIQWNTLGNSQITLEVTENGCTSPITNQPVTVFPLPVASFTNNNAYCEGGVTHIVFTGTAGPSATFNWNFGNGTVQSGSGSGPYQVVFPSVGQEQISLIVTENGCNSFPYTQTVTIHPFPVVNLPQPQPQCLGQNSFDFSVQGTFGSNVSYNWAFASATPYSSNQANPQNITWSAPGTFSVVVVVTENGCSTPAWTSVVIYPDPIPTFTAQPTSGCVPLEVTFSNTTNAVSPTQVTWNFGNGQSATGDTPTAVYTVPGNYSVSMTLTDAYGCTVSTTMPGLIVAHPAPVAGFSASPLVMEIEEPDVVITDNSQYASQWLYTFGDGVQSNQQNPTHSYQNTGQYVITQTVSNAFGCSDTASLVVVVNPVSEVFVPNTFTPNGDGLNDIWQPVMSYIRHADIWVFDRWGEIVFHTDDVYTGWDGTFKNQGRPMKQDTYVYLIEYKNFAGKTKTLRGALNLVR